MKNFCRKSLVLSGIVLLSNPISLLLLGLVNRILFRPVRSLFIVYPASQKYVDHYGFKFIQPYLKKIPVICGLYFQGGSPGLIFGISGTEKDFEQQNFVADLKRNSDLVASWLGITSIKYSGILPSAMQRKGVLEPQELHRRSGLVGQVVSLAEQEVRQQLAMSNDAPVVLLGGRGSVGIQLKKQLLKEGRTVYTVDRQDDFPQQLRGQEVILIDVARKGALEQIIPELWDGVVLLNETYPAPRKRVIRDLEERGVPVFHIAGVQGFAFPQFPHAYSGGIPCCGMNEGGVIRPMLKYLSTGLA
ncbi:MAG: hypothetical protein VX764_09160 [Planctomycetota bacterium]|nr:hypothetical protein [Planctomycetota bacterium]